MQWLTGGGFWLHVVTANINAFSLSRSMRYLREFGLLMPCFVALPLLALWTARSHRRAQVLIGTYSAGALLSALTVGKLGSNVNYLLELCAACAIGCGWMLAFWPSPGRRRTATTVAITLQLALLLGGSRYRQNLDEKLALQEQQHALFEFVRGTAGSVLADDAAGLLPLAGKPIEIQPFEMARLAEAGIWDQQPFVARMGRREFSAILMQQLPWSPIHRTRWTPEMLQQIEQQYVASQRVGYTVVYLPRED